MSILLEFYWSLKSIIFQMFLSWKKKRSLLSNTLNKIPLLWQISLSSQNSFLRLSQNTVTYNEKLQFRLNKMLIQNNVICYHIIIRLLHFQACNSYCILNHCCVWNGLLIFGMLEALMIFCQKNLVVAGVSTQIWIVTLCRVRDYT